MMQNNLNGYEYEYGVFIEWHWGRYPEDEGPGYHSIATRLWLDIWGIVVNFAAGTRDSLHQSILTGFGSHRVLYSVGTRIYFPASTVAKVKNVWPYTSTSPYTFVTCTGKLNFIFFNFKIMCVLLTESQGLLLSLAMWKELNKDLKFRFSECMQNTLQHQTLCGSDLGLYYAQ